MSMLSIFPENKDVFCIIKKNYLKFNSIQNPTSSNSSNKENFKVSADYIVIYSTTQMPNRGTGNIYLKA